MDVRDDRLEQLLLCIGTKFDLGVEIVRDPRFGVRLEQAIRSCLGGTTSEAELFMESLFGRSCVDAYRSAGAKLSASPVEGTAGGGPDPGPLLEDGGA